MEMNRRGKSRRISSSESGESESESFVVEDSDDSLDDGKDAKNKYRNGKNNVIQESSSDEGLPLSRKSHTSHLDTAPGSSTDERVTPSIEKAIRRSIHRIAHDSESEQVDDVSDSDSEGPLVVNESVDDESSDEPNLSKVEQSSKIQKHFDAKRKSQRQKAREESLIEDSNDESDSDEAFVDPNGDDNIDNDLSDVQYSSNVEQSDEGEISSIKKAIRRSIHRITKETEDQEADGAYDSDEPAVKNHSKSNIIDVDASSDIEYLPTPEKSEHFVHDVESTPERATNKPKLPGSVDKEIRRIIRAAVNDDSSDDETNYKVESASLKKQENVNNAGTRGKIRQPTRAVAKLESSDDEDSYEHSIAESDSSKEGQIVISDESMDGRDTSVNRISDISDHSLQTSFALSMAKEETANTTFDPMAAQKRALLVCKQQQLETQLAKSKKLYTVGAMNALPDGGEKLRLSIESTEKELTRVLTELHTIPTTIESPNFPQMRNEVKPSLFKTESLDIDPTYLQPTTNKIDKELGKKAQETLHREQSLTVERLQALHGSLVARPAEDERAKDPRGLKVPLMAHQQHALLWLLWRESQKPPGGVLADDMGLGKTLTMIALIMASKAMREAGEISDDDEEWQSSARQQRYLGGTLVVAPASLVAQWAAEVSNRCKSGILSVELHHGNNRETMAKRLARNDIVITTYNILSREFKTTGCPFKIRWRRVILDEAHVIRNHKSQTCESVCGLSANARWALTGTPIHNKEMDLYAILKFLRCSPFDDVRVWKRWVDNKNAAGHERLATVMKTLMLRRTKQELQAKGSLASLPDKSIEVINVELDKEERLVYDKVMVYSRTIFAQYLSQRAEKAHMFELGAGKYDKPSWTVTHKNTQFTKAQNVLLSMHADVQSFEILVLLLRLRQVCCHPSLIHSMLDQQDIEQDGTEVGGTDFDLMAKMNKMKLEESAEEEPQGDVGVDERVADNLLTSENPVFSSGRRSSKMRMVLEKIEEILDKGDKVIIVSQWVSVLDILANELDSVKGAAYAMFTGKVAVKDRQGIMDDFNSRRNNPNILLLSLTAGGVGLNLVGANHLLLIDIHWNPQLESQAQDRIYRFGQKKDVYVYKYICTDTIEERIKALQEKKLELAEAVLSGGGKVVGSKLTLDDIKSLFSL